MIQFFAEFDEILCAHIQIDRRRTELQSQIVREYPARAIHRENRDIPPAGIEALPGNAVAAFPAKTPTEHSTSADDLACETNYLAFLEQKHAMNFAVSFLRMNSTHMRLKILECTKWRGVTEMFGS